MAVVQFYLSPDRFEWQGAELHIFSPSIWNEAMASLLSLVSVGRPSWRQVQIISSIKAVISLIKKKQKNF